MVADEENLSEGTSQNPVLQSSDERDSEQSLGGGSAESQRTGGNSREADGTESRADGADESGRYDEVGSPDEQHQELGTGNREESGTEIEESDDGHGNIVQTETTVTETFLYITVSHKTVDEMAAMYGFNQEQKEYLAELLKDENNQLWSQVLYGIGYSDDQIVTVALSQVGNVGGQPYWSWYGFDSRVEWCACFVSWCANECGYIDAGIIPKYAGCVNGVQWFRDRGQWADGSYEPSPGTIIFFDWEGDGVTDHTGIVQKCENGTVYTVEGNSGDTCRTKTYPVGSSVIYGYGIPAY